MHEIRIHLNQEQGTRWWAEDDLGFTGGADRLSDLLRAAREWAELEALGLRVRFRLVGAAAPRPPQPTIHYSGGPCLPPTSGAAFTSVAVCTAI